MDPGTQFSKYVNPYGPQDAKFTALGDRGGAFAALAAPRSAAQYSYSHDTSSQQGALFTAKDYSKPPTVTSIGAQPGMEHHTATLLGLAAQHSLSHYGRLPAASSDLSKHSSPIVAHLARKGVIDMPTGVQHNAMDKGASLTGEWTKSNILSGLNESTTVPPESVASASRFTRSLLRRPRQSAAPGRQMEFHLGHDV